MPTIVGRVLEGVGQPEFVPEAHPDRRVRLTRIGQDFAREAEAHQIDISGYLQHRIQFDCDAIDAKWAWKVDPNSLERR